MESTDGNILYRKYYTYDEKINIKNYQTTHKDKLKQIEEIKYEPKIYPQVNQSNRKNKFIHHDSKIIQSYLIVNLQINKNIREKFSIRTKPIQKVRGDLLPLSDIDDGLMLKNFSYEIENKKHEIKHEYNTLDNVIMNYISKEELKMIKERDPTPKNEKKKFEPEEEMKRCNKKSHTSIASNKIQKTSSVTKFHKIITDEKSIIKLPPDCKFMIIFNKLYIRHN
jgi:hypothetical protein